MNSKLSPSSSSTVSSPIDTYGTSHSSTYSTKTANISPHVPPPTNLLYIQMNELSNTTSDPSTTPSTTNNTRNTPKNLIINPNHNNKLDMWGNIIGDPIFLTPRTHTSNQKHARRASPAPLTSPSSSSVGYGSPTGTTGIYNHNYNRPSSTTSNNQDWTCGRNSVSPTFCVADSSAASSWTSTSSIVCKNCQRKIGGGRWVSHVSKGECEGGGRLIRTF